jgi:hypothetical protein
MVRHPTICLAGCSACTEFFDRAFSSSQSYKVDILKMDVIVNGNMGLVCTIQRVSVVLETSDRKPSWCAKRIASRSEMVSGN